MPRDHRVFVLTLEKGTFHRYHSDAFGTASGPEYRPPEAREVVIREVPDEIALEVVQAAAQEIINLGGGFPSPCRWERDIAAPLLRKAAV